MTELKTNRNDGDVEAYLESVENQRRREDALVLLDCLSNLSWMKRPEMWGT